MKCPLPILIRDAKRGSVRNINENDSSNNDDSADSKTLSDADIYCMGFLHSEDTDSDEKCVKYSLTRRIIFRKMIW